MVLVHFCGSAMAVEVPILARQRGAVAWDQPPEGAALLGKPGDPLAWPRAGRVATILNTECRDEKFPGCQ